MPTAKPDRRPLNYTTNVPVAKTIGEVQQLLADAGADAVSVDYTDRVPSGLAFRLDTPHGARAYRLPVNISAVQSLLLQREQEGAFRTLRKATGTFTTDEHAARVAWRVAKDWLEAQLALLDATLATVDQVMLPYLVVDRDDRTLYDAWREREDALAIEGGDR
jgi:hypothetical protein